MSAPMVLCYHALSPDWSADLSLTPERFRAQMELLLRHGFRGATFTRAALGPTPRRTMVITFDDAYRSVLELGLPILADLGIPATIFAPTAAVNARRASWPGVDHWAGGPHGHELDVMGWDELGELAGRGWEVASHTISHPHLTACDDLTLARELGDSKRELEDRLAVPCTSLAYPYGSVDHRVVHATRAAGYLAAAGLPKAMHAPVVLNWPRIGVYFGDHEPRFRLKTTGMVQRLRTVRTRDVAGRPR